MVLSVLEKKIYKNCSSKEDKEAEKENSILLFNKVVENKIKQIARNLNEGKKITFGTTSKTKYYIVLECCAYLEQRETRSICIQGVIYCYSKDFLYKVIAEIGEEALRKYLLIQY